MRHLFILNSNTTANDLKEAINDLLGKTKAVLTCIIFSTGFVREEVELDSQILFDALSVADDCLDELTQLFTRLENIQCGLQQNPA